MRIRASPTLQPRLKAMLSSFRRSWGSVRGLGTDLAALSLLLYSTSTPCTARDYYAMIANSLHGQ